MGLVSLPPTATVGRFRAHLSLDASELAQVTSLFRAAASTPLAATPPPPLQPVYAAPPPPFLPAPTLAPPPSQLVPSRSFTAEPDWAWRRVFSADPAEHNNEAVAAVLWRASVPDLPGGDGHAGWLVSAGRGVLNLWECSASGGKGGEPSVMLMHAQLTAGLTAHALAADEGTATLLAACADGRQAGVAALYRLRGGGTLLGRKGALPAPPPTGGAMPAPGKAGAKTPQPRVQVAALAPLRGPLARAAAVAVSNSVVVYALPEEAAGSQGAAPQQAPPPLARWSAGEVGCSVTCVAPWAIEQSAPGPFLLAGLAQKQGPAIRGWDLRAKPSITAAAAALELAAPHGPTGAGGPMSVTPLAASAPTLLATFAGGAVAIYDARAAGKVLAQAPAPPGGFAALRCAAAASDGSALAVTTAAGGLLVLSGLLAAARSSGGLRWQAVAAGGAGSVGWNSFTGELVCGGLDGSVGVYRMC